MFLSYYTEFLGLRSHVWGLRESFFDCHLAVNFADDACRTRCTCVDQAGQQFTPDLIADSLSFLPTLLGAADVRSYCNYGNVPSFLASSIYLITCTVAN
jgi:hypothetical protein